MESISYLTLTCPRDVIEADHSPVGAWHKSSTHEYRETLTETWSPSFEFLTLTTEHEDEEEEDMDDVSSCSSDDRSTHAYDLDGVDEMEWFLTLTADHDHPEEDADEVASYVTDDSYLSTHQISSVPDESLSYFLTLTPPDHMPSFVPSLSSSTHEPQNPFLYEQGVLLYLVEVAPVG
ncbi:hypothetical protein DFQ28_009171 [Apophysomyces sp. BC1034]|nr:hypothetical protein DFQ30_009713 [Apophysomyces sp. BC1015]KAG0176981.1 hypothetical protein DFQ29_005383 [Apophysomyces sp. BC1021]KAG0192446.1 hypothetical protein DFQ28_009171 [Apophysomyces sp. BC1034]